MCRFLIFFFISTTIFSQKKVIKTFETTSKEIEISTIGLDDFIIENSTSEFIEISLFAEDSNQQHIVVSDKEGVLNIEFTIPEITREETVFRKFITKRLNRAFATIKIPKGKKVTVFGEIINLESKNYQGDLAIYIEEGLVKLHKIYANTLVKMYGGVVSANLKDYNLNLNSKTGKIKIDDVFYNQKYQKTLENNKYSFSVTTIKANIFLTTQ